MFYDLFSSFNIYAFRLHLFLNLLFDMMLVSVLDTTCRSNQES